MNPRVGVVTQARTTSTRLPGKVLIEAGGRTMLDHHLDRLGAAGLEVYVATTVNATDDGIVAVAERRGLPCHRGSEADVLSRFAGVVREHDLDVVVRVTSDCPLIDADLVAEGVRRWLALGDPDAYLSNGIERTFPRGFDLEVFSGERLLTADAEATAAAEREHVTPWLYRGPAAGAVHHLRGDRDRSAYRLTLDTPDDLRLITLLIEEHAAHTLSGPALCDLLDAHPDLAAVNAHVEQKKLTD